MIKYDSSIKNFMTNIALPTVAAIGISIPLVKDYIQDQVWDYKQGSAYSAGKAVVELSQLPSQDNIDALLSKK